MTMFEQTKAVTVRPITYEVSLLPMGNINRRYYAITVEWRGADRWAVMHMGYCLSVDGEWDCEMQVSNRDDGWLDEHRFSLTVALHLAKAAAPKVEVNGRTASQVAAALIGDDHG